MEILMNIFFEAYTHNLLGTIQQLPLRSFCALILTLKYVGESLRCAILIFRKAAALEGKFPAIPKARKFTLYDAKFYNNAYNFQRRRPNFEETLGEKPNAVGRASAAVLHARETSGAKGCTFMLRRVYQTINNNWEHEKIKL